MDFSLNDEHLATRELAKQILGDLVTPERHKELESAGEFVDTKAWSALSDAGLVGISTPESHGGAGLGFLAAALVLEEVGRTVAKVPYLSAVVLGAMPMAEFGSPEQQSNWLGRLVDGSARATTALMEGVATGATSTGDTWTFSGRRDFVPDGLGADLVLVPASTNVGTTVFLVDPKSNGVTLIRQDTTTGIPEAQIVLDGAGVVGVLGEVGGGDDIVDWITLRATAALCATAVGVCEAALRITAEY